MKKFLLGLVLLAKFACAQSSEIDILGQSTTIGNVVIGTQDAGVQLTAIQLSPQNPSVPLNTTTAFSAQGTYSDGSNQDITTQAVWSTLSGGTIALTSGPSVLCVGVGTDIVFATLAGVSGTTSITCQSLQISPTGTLTATQSQPFSQLFTASSGTPPYTFSASGLPGWLVLSNSGCGASQINCNLSGTPTILGSSTLNLTGSDSAGGTLTIPITVQVVAASAEDNKYCLPSGVSTVNGQTDGPANMIHNCVYNAIASTPSVCMPPGCTVPVLTVCPTTEIDSHGNPIVGCHNGLPPFYSTIQAALNALTACGQHVDIFSVNYQLQGLGYVRVQNVYDEKLVFPGVACGPNDPTGNAQWIWVESTDVGLLPPPGTRISPAWAGVTSLPGRPSYIQPAIPGIYVPFINPSVTTCGNNPGCQALIVGGGGVIPSGIRFMGLEFAWTKTHATAPGYFGQLIQVGCSTSDCPQGASHVIFDRVIVHACQDKTDAICTDSAPVGIQVQNGNYNAVINSYLYGFKTIGDNQGFQGPQDESHGLSGGNIQGDCTDGPTQILNNFIEAASQPFFWGGAASDPAHTGCTDGAHPYDIEIRHNALFRPLTYMVGPFNPQHNFAGGKIFDMFMGAHGTAYSSAAVCSVVPPPSGIQATCTITVSGGGVVDVNVVNPGSGYTAAQPGTVAWRFPNTDPACGTAFGCTTPLAVLTVNTTGGTIATAKKISVVTVFVHASDGFITDPNLSVGGNPVYSTITTAGCTGGGCQVVVAHPTLPPGFSGYSVYSCDATGAACKGQLQTASAVCVNITVDCVIRAVGTGPGSGNEPATISEANTQVEDGIYIIKNDGECKHCVRVLFEGNVATNLWTGQSDESATCWLYRATNDIEQDKITQNCPNCKVVDIVNRYNVCRGATSGISIGQQQATRGGTIGESTGFASFHDLLFELSGMWITAANQFVAGAGTTITMANAGQPGTQALQSIKLNHITTFHTEPASFSQQSTRGSFASLLTALCGVNGKVNTNAVWNGMVFENMIAGGGYRNGSPLANGCFQCAQSAGGCNSTIALSSVMTNSGEGPVVSGAYTTNQVTGIQLNSGGSCSVAISSCTITGDGTGATCSPNYDPKTKSLRAIAINSYGGGYTHAAVTFGGCSGGGDVLPTTTVFLGGAGNPSPAGPWCSDHNINITAGWSGEDPMTPDPTAQGDSTNACFSTPGGSNQDVTNWAGMQFVNATFDPLSGLPVTEDFHLSNTSPGHLASNGDNVGRDVANGGPTLNDAGADIDLILLYTGCTIQSGVLVCP